MTSDLVLTGISKEFGAHRAVDDLDLTVPEGAFFALLGPSGCGKTTTLRMVAGLEEPTAGKIRLGEQDITGLRPYKRPVNTVFQNYALFPHLDIFENVAFGLRRRGVKDFKPKVDEMLDLVELGGVRQAQAEPAVRWPAATSRTGPGADQPPAGAAAGRAARCARPQAAPADAAGAEADPDRGRHHVRARHPRPGGGHDDGRHHRGDERRRDRADGYADRALRPARDDVRGELPRSVQPDPGRDHRPGRREPDRGRARTQGDRATAQVPGDRGRRLDGDQTREGLPGASGHRAEQRSRTSCAVRS